MKPFWNRSNGGRAAAAMLLAGFVLAGCVPSLNPLHTEKDIVYEPGLLGEWSEDDSPQDRWRFEPGDDRSYRVTYTEGDEQGEFTVRLLELDGHRYLDFEPVRKGIEAMGQTGFYRIHWVPAHTFACVELKDGMLRMAMVNADWLDKHLEQDPSRLAHRRTGDDELVLTASTEQLQRFVKEHRNELFGDSVELRRSPATP
jgi:hypothetical protein